ncbi:MAG TPA: hypothetical protein VFH90_09410 [Candidatus Limnocylindria bacterium]|nr:hypothetical protein [Candidatus Limnocylindria bacterium]
MSGRFVQVWATAFAPAALAATYVLNIAVTTGMSPFAIGRALVLAVVAACAITGMAVLLLRNPARGGLAATALVAFIIVGRDVALIVGNVLHAVPAWQALLLLTLAAALVLAAFRTLRSSGRKAPSAPAWMRAVNVLALASILVFVASATSQGLLGQWADDLQQGSDLESAADRSAVVREGPDIYLILLDGYPRADVLAGQFAFDNSDFLEALGTRGFDVSTSSHSNYVLTEFTLLSMFNMDLLQEIPELRPVLDGTLPAQPASRNALNQNPSFDVLRDHGYAIVGLAGSYEDVALRRADVFVQTDNINELEWELLANTFVLDVIDWIAPHYFADRQRAFIDSSFEQARRIAENQRLGPRFVMAHVFAPRSPLVFGPSGEAADLEVLRRTEDTAAAAGLSQEEFGQRLIGQVTHVNRKTIDLIDAIRSNSPTPPVIIVMSDHGSRSQALDPSAATPDQVRERFGTLFAAFTPDQSEVFPDDVTPAQVMGLLLNAYFDVPYREPGDGIYASEADHYTLVRLGDAPPTPSP